MVSVYRVVSCYWTHVVPAPAADSSVTVVTLLGQDDRLSGWYRVLLPLCLHAKGRAIAQAVSLWLPIAAARVRTRV
jgi:hypothetical protein